METKVQTMVGAYGIRSPFLRGLAYGLFWSWNVIFLAFMLLGFAPNVLLEMITATRAGEIPTTFLVYAAMMTLIPAVALVLGATILRRSPGKLFALGYGVEWPLMLTLAIRLFAVREATPAIALLVSTAGVGMAAFLWQILDPHVHTRRSLLAHLRLIGMILLLVTGLYVSLCIAFYAIPLSVWASRAVATMRSYGSLSMDAFLFWLLALLVLAYGSSLFVAMPISMPLLYVYAWWQEVRALGARYGRPRVIAVTGAVLIACLILVLQTSRQPQHRAFALLETPPTSLDGVRTLLQQEDAIRTGLVNAYLAPYRYFGAVGVAQDVSDMYIYALDVPQVQAMRIQQVYEAVARPILYEPVNTPSGRGRSANRALQEEAAQAAEMYEAFFDREIVEGERDAVLRAVRSTWSIDQARAARRDVGDSEVHLKHQEISIAENGDWAEVELYEVYQNHTTQRQEVVYYFSLPESAVITGVWLGNSANRAARFVYQVAPRGAAQQVYRSEVRYNRDPALVEQIGPRQYRLRVFPIEPQLWRWNGNRSYVEAGPEMHMWLTWRILADDNTWPLPRLAEKRNVCWDGDSVRLVNGERMIVDEENWLPASVPATSPVEPVTHRVDFPGGRTVLIQPTMTVDSPQPTAGLRFGVVLDRSRSMAQHAADVETALTQLTQVADSGVSIDVYLTASQYRGEAPSRASLAEIVPDEIIYYGGQNAAELLAQFDELRAGDDYDVILVLTDGTGYELGDRGIAVPVPDAPVWMVHLAGDFPLGYDDATLEAIQASGGGAVSSVGEALTRSAISQTTWFDVIDGYTWFTVPTEVAEAQLEGTDTVIVDAASGDFAAFAARQLILAETHRQRGQMDQLETLDHLHAIAVEHGIVTPYSSMIVLVEQRQEKLLEELETQGDRFEREHEAVGETTPPNTFDLPGETTLVSTPNVTGVPEPEEWLLLVLAAVMLIWYVYTKRLAPRRQYIR